MKIYRENNISIYIEKKCWEIISKSAEEYITIIGNGKGPQTWPYKSSSNDSRLIRNSKPDAGWKLTHAATEC